VISEPAPGSFSARRPGHLGTKDARSTVARVAARIAFMFERSPTLNHVEVYLSARGYLCVRSNSPAGSAVLGTYTRQVTIAQIVDDLAGVKDE
jgi:hypothetical protein